MRSFLFVAWRLNFVNLRSGSVVSCGISVPEEVDMAEVIPVEHWHLDELVVLDNVADIRGVVVSMESNGQIIWFNGVVESQPGR